MNCSQPWQPAFGEAAQAGLEKKFEFSCSVYAFATCPPEPPICPAREVTPETLSNEPMAVEMWPLGTWAEMSSPSPITIGRGPLRGAIGYSGVFTHLSRRHSRDG